MANYKIGISTEAGIKSEILAESKKVLESIAAKYNCKFEFYQTEIKATAKAVASKVRKQANTGNKVGLSVCGKIDL